MDQRQEDNDSKSCPLCGSRELHLRFEKAGYCHFECCSCSSLHVLPTPSLEELEHYYNEKDRQISKICWESSREHFRPIWGKALRWIEESSGRGPLLDVGCGGGQFLAFASEGGWDALYGLDLSQQAVDIAAQRTGADVRCSELFTADFGDIQFAGVTLWDVLEHYTNPGYIMDRIHRLLRPGGVIVISVPHLHGLSIRLLGKKAQTFMPPEHLTFFSVRSMKAFLEKHRYHLLAVECTDIFIREWTRFLPTRTRVDTNPTLMELDWEKIKYQQCYGQMTEKRMILTSIQFVNIFLRGLRLGDELIAAGRKPDPNF
jgi:2-polyprenyl-3-methyl-5-hydroxy-6-metoxy-1,4-benzoquinol methylase